MSLLFTAVFLLGSAAAAAQVLYLREFLVVFHGNEMAIGLVFAAWFLGIACGAAAAAIPARRFRTGATAPFVGSLLPLPVAVPAGILIARSWGRIAGLAPGGYPPAATIAAGAFASVLPLAGVVGFSFAAACNAARASEDRLAVGRVYLAESLGSVAGGLLITYALLPRLAPATIVLILVGGSLMACASAALHGRPSGLRRPGPVPILCAAGMLLLLLIGLLGGHRRLDAWASSIRWRTLLGPGFAEDLVEETDTPYQNLAVFERDGQFSVLADGRYLCVFPDDLAYETAAHTILTQHSDPKRVLVLGGVPAVLRPLLEEPLERVDWVQIDPGLLRTLRPYLPEEDRRTLRDPRLRLVRADAAAYLRNPVGPYDVVLLETSGPTTISANRFFTLEFYRRVRRALSPGGVFGFRLSTSVHLEEESAELLACIRRTLREVFDRVLVGGGAERWFFAGDARSSATLDGETLFDRFRERPVRTRAFSPYFFLGSETFDPEKVDHARRRIDGVESPRLNSDLHPVAPLYALRIWGRYAGSSLASLPLNAARRPARLWIAAAWAAAGLVVLVRRVRGRRADARLPGVALIGAIGFSAFALHLVHLTLCQDLLGYVYEKIGAVNAIFMAGLALGAWIVQSAIRTRNRPPAASAAVPALACAGWGVVTAAAAWVLVRAAPGSPLGGPAAAQFAVGLLALGNGVLTGAAFPWVNHWMRTRGASPVRTAAWTDAADHLGAVAGALLVGIVWLPAFGIVGASLLGAAVELAVLPLVMTVRTR